MLQNLEDLKRMSESAWIYLNLRSLIFLDLSYGLMDNRLISMGALKHGHEALAPPPSGNVVNCCCA